MQRQTPGIVALAEDNREDAAAESDVRFLYRYGRAGMSAFFVRTRLNTRLIPIVCKGVFPFGRKLIPLNQKGILPCRPMHAVSQNFALMRPIVRDGLQTALFCRFTAGIRASCRWAEAARRNPVLSFYLPFPLLRRRTPRNNPRAPRL